MEKVIAVAMSGGVDSSLTAAMLLKQGYKVFGITLWLWVSGTPYDEVPLAVTDAKKMCDFLVSSIMLSMLAMYSNRKKL